MTYLTFCQLSAELSVSSSASARLYQHSTVIRRIQRSNTIVDSSNSASSGLCGADNCWHMRTVVMALFQHLHMVTPPVQSSIEPVEDPLCIQPSVFLPIGASQMRSLRNHLIACHEPHGKPNAAWLNIMRSCRRHIPGAHHSIPIRLDTLRIVHIVYNHTDPEHYFYVTCGIISLTLSLALQCVQHYSYTCH